MMLPRLGSCGLLGVAPAQGPPGAAQNSSGDSPPFPQAGVTLESAAHLSLSPGDQGSLPSPAQAGNKEGETPAQQGSVTPSAQWA